VDRRGLYGIILSISAAAVMVLQLEPIPVLRGFLSVS
jgi:hypothetical protein